MPYITREDGERFVIPSYRDVISAKKQNLLKREILLLSQNHGEYITLHRKNVEQYEVAFSPDTGYLLGETVWHYFKRPLDLIYCEAIPNTMDAILVIVKSGSVYLDGSFPIDSIADELVIFRTQQNNFDIYVYGEVPISKTPDEYKFSFDPASVRSFQELDEPVFPKLPKVKNFQLQLVDAVLKAQGIDALPVKQIGVVAFIICIGWLVWLYMSTHQQEVTISFVANYVDPLQAYTSALTSPDPATEIHRINDNFKKLYSMPGWVPDTIEYNKGIMRVGVKTMASQTSLLYAWANKNNYQVLVLPDGFYIATNIIMPPRRAPTFIYLINETIAKLSDRLSVGMPGDHLQVTPIVDKRSYAETTVTISFTNISPEIFDWLGVQLKDLPLVLTKVTITATRGNLSGLVTLQVLGYKV